MKCNERMNLVGTMDPFVGKYFSIDYIRRQVLKQTDTEIAEIDKQIDSEMAEGKIMDPMPKKAMMANGGMDMEAGQGEVVADDPAAGNAPLFR